ncbi:Aldo/keto reductase [Clavulina sp. PMI_390]|nr:Aldo/keto reductase [Clavulina sp. PMI_390]
MTLQTFKIADSAVTTIGYGAMGIGGYLLVLGMAYGIAGTDEERFAVLDRLWDLGERNIDTASGYGDSEVLIGKWLKIHPERRSQLFIATKFGFASDGTIRGDPEFVREQVNQSLKRLGVDYIDLLYQHRPDKSVPIEITVRAMAEFVKAGSVKYLGLSECTSNGIRRAQQVHPIAAVQVEYSPIELFHEGREGVIPTCRELGITIVAYSPTARGILTGRYHPWQRGPEDFDEGDFRSSLPKFTKENFPKVLKMVDGLSSIGMMHGNATAAQVAIAWVAGQGMVVVPGAKQMKYVEENLAADRIKLSAEELGKIRGWADELDWTNGGPRYGPGLEELSGVETPAFEE